MRIIINVVVANLDVTDQYNLKLKKCPNDIQCKNLLHRRDLTINIKSLVCID